MKKDDCTRQRLRASGVHRDIWRTNLHSNRTLSYNTLLKKKKKINGHGFKMVKHNNKQTKSNDLLHNATARLKSCYNLTFHQIDRRHNTTHKCLNSPLKILILKVPQKDIKARQSSQTSITYRVGWQSQYHAIW